MWIERSELVVVGVERRNFGLETLADTDLGDEFLELATFLNRSCKSNQ